MRKLATSRRAARPEVAVPAPAPVAAENDPCRHIRWLIWLYFALLLLEGALRKWFLPSLSNPLLLIRDPVVIAIYGLAIARGVFPSNRYVIAIAIVCTLSVVVSLFGPFSNLGVHLFGWRCNVLHLPLIYVMGRVLDYEQVKRVGYAVLLIAVPMTLLVVWQFRSVPDAWVNRGAGDGAAQITLTWNKVRPSGTFSFVSGIIYFYALATAFLIYGMVERRTYPIWLTAIVGLCIPATLAVSGSRSTVALSAIVAFCFVLALVLRPSLIGKAMKLIGITAVLVFFAGSIAVFQAAFDEGMEAFTQRLKDTENVEGGLEGFVARFAGTFTKPLHMLFEVPLFGYGIGVGTNVGAKLLTGRLDYMIAEDEWERVIGESGAFLGGIYLLLRVMIAAQLTAMCIRAARLGHFLPLLLLGTCGLAIVSGQFGQATSLGFTVFLAGLCLASMHLPAPVAAAVAAATKPRRQLPAKVLATRAAIEARNAAARGSGWAQKVLDPRP